MTDEEARAAMEARRGPKPQSPFGFEIGPIAIPPTHHQRQRDYRSDLAAWERGDMAPLPTVGQFADTTGYSPERGALPNQYNSIERTEPSSVPHYGLEPKGYGTPQAPDQRMAITPGTGERHPYNPQFLNSPAFEHNPDPLAPQVGQGGMQPRLQSNTAYTSNQYTPEPPPQPQGPLTAQYGAPRQSQPQGPLTPQAGAPQQIQRQEINREAPINNVQQNLMDASLYSQRYQGRYGRGAGASTLNAKQQMNFEALVKGGMPEDEAYILSRSMATGMENTTSLMGDRANKQDHRKFGEGISERNMKMKEDLAQARMDHMKYLENKEKEMRAAGKSPQDIALMRLQDNHNFRRMVIRAWNLQHSNLSEPERDESLADMMRFMEDDLSIQPTKSGQSHIPETVGGLEVPFVGGAAIPFTGGEREFSPGPGARTHTNPFNRLPQPTPAPKVESETTEKAQGRLQSVDPEPWKKYPKTDPRSKPENWQKK